MNEYFRAQRGTRVGNQLDAKPVSYDNHVTSIKHELSLCPTWRNFVFCFFHLADTVGRRKTLEIIDFSHRASSVRNENFGKFKRCSNSWLTFYVIKISWKSYAGCTLFSLSFSFFVRWVLETILLAWKSFSDINCCRWRKNPNGNSLFMNFYYHCSLLILSICFSSWG